MQTSTYKALCDFEFEVEGNLYEYKSGQIYEFTEEQAAQLPGKVEQYEPTPEPDPAVGEETPAEPTKGAEPVAEPQNPSPQVAPEPTEIKNPANEPTQEAPVEPIVPTPEPTPAPKQIKVAKPWIGNHDVMTNKSVSHKKKVA